MKEIIWSVCTGEDCNVLQSFVKSLRNNGFNDDIVVFSEFSIDGAASMTIDNSIIFDKLGLWKFEYLKRLSSAHGDAIFAYFSPQHICVKKLPLSFSELLMDMDIFCFLESNIVGSSAIRDSWVGVNRFKLHDVAKSFGVLHNYFYNLNANHFIIKSSFVNHFSQLKENLYQHMSKRGMVVNDEIVLSFIVNMVNDDIEKMLIKNNSQYYCLDWKGFFQNRLPDGSHWDSEDYFTGSVVSCNSSLVYCPNSYGVMSKSGRNMLGSRISDVQNIKSSGCGACKRNKK